jgi:hypothetical protein
MSAPPAVRVARAAVLGAGALLASLVAAASPAAAHDVGGGALPAPPWLLSYIGAFAVVATAITLRATWTTPRLRGFAPAASSAVPAQPAVATAERSALGLHVGHLVGVVLFVLVFVAAVVGPDSAAANIAPVTVLVVWWVGLPIVCLLVGDVMRAINPFVALVSVLDRRSDERSDTGAPSWTAAAFAASFGWYFVAYHRPGSPRALAVFMAIYAVAAVGAGLRWGRRWLAIGEGFGALSAGVAVLSPLGRRGAAAPPGIGALSVVLIGSTAFDAFASTPFWVDVLGTSQGWTRTWLNTVGLLWLTAIVAGAYLLAIRYAERGEPAGDTTEDTTPSLVGPIGIALVPLALGWFLAHDLTLLLFEGQNFVALLSDPLGRGWDLIGTIGHTVDLRLVQSSWVRWLQVGLMAAGHVVAVVIAHDTALRVVRPRLAVRVTWGIAAAAAASVVAGALMVLG